MSKQWSQRFSEGFRASLPPDVADWLDGRIRHDLDSPHLGDFAEALDPEKLLDQSSGAVWGGQMLPDTVPILDNGCGDVISLRFGPDGHVSEVIRWDHETGYWRPYGHTLAEAVLCDLGTMKREGALDRSEEARHQPRSMEDWAVDWTRRTTGPALKWSDPYEGDRLSVFRTLLDAGVCEVVARRELCSVSLTCKLMDRCTEIGGWQIAERLGVPWPVVAEWLFDTALIPEQYRQPLSQTVNTSIDQLIRQDWDHAAEEAQRVRQLRPDLGWPYAIMGWAAERNHNPTAAVDHYLAGLETLGTSCGFMVKVEHDFVVKRLGELRGHLPRESRDDPYLQAALAPRTPETFPSSIRGYWMGQAEEAEQRGQHDQAYRCYYSAGWDDFVANDMDVVLDGLVRTAEAAGYSALHCIARHHRASWEALERLTPPTRATWPTRLRARIKRLLG